MEGLGSLAAVFIKHYSTGPSDLALEKTLLVLFICTCYSYIIPGTIPPLVTGLDHAQGEAHGHQAQEEQQHTHLTHAEGWSCGLTQQHICVGFIHILSSQENLHNHNKSVLSANINTNWRKIKQTIFAHIFLQQAKLL